MLPNLIEFQPLKHIFSSFLSISHIRPRWEDSSRTVRSCWELSCKSLTSLSRHSQPPFWNMGGEGGVWVEWEHDQNTDHQTGQLLWTLKREDILCWTLWRPFLTNTYWTGVYEPCQICSMVSSRLCDNKTRQISKEFFLSMLLLVLSYLSPFWSEVQL